MDNEGISYDKETYLSFAGMQLESGAQQREEEAEMGAMPNFALQSAIDEYVDRMAAKLPELEERPLLEVRCLHIAIYVNIYLMLKLSKTAHTCVRDTRLSMDPPFAKRP